MPRTTTLRFDAIGTHWEIETNQPIDSAVCADVLSRIDRFDTTYSRFRPDTLVSQVAEASEGGRFDFPDDSLALFDLYDRLFTASDGAVDPLVGCTLERLGYDAAYTLIPNSEVAQENQPAWPVEIVREGTALITRRRALMDVPH